eukprot:9381343-Pyramimonas_sp.AAC.1
MVETARFARSAVLRGKQSDPLSRYVACRAIARAVWSPDIALAQRIFPSHNLGQKHLEIDVLAQ